MGMKAQQDCRSYKNTGIFDGSNPDPQGNQNAWGIYKDGVLIATMKEATKWRPQAEVNDDACLLAAALQLREALVEMTDTYEAVLCFCGDEDDAIHQRKVKKARKAIENSHYPPKKEAMTSP